MQADTITKTPWVSTSNLTKFRGVKKGDLSFQEAQEVTRRRHAPGRKEEEEWPNAAKKKAGNWVNAMEMAPPTMGGSCSEGGEPEGGRRKAGLMAGPPLRWFQTKGNMGRESWGRRWSED